MGLKIVRNDITKERVDAIVTPAYWVPEVGTGVDRAIHEAAGPELLAARRALGVLEQGDAFATPAFKLPAKFVIHTLGPFWEDGERHEKLILRLCYVNVLREALLRACRSVAVPLLSAGNFGMPADEALDCAVGAIRRFLARGNDLEVRLVVVDDRAWRHAKARHGDIASSVLTDAQARELAARHPPAGRSRLAPGEKTEYFGDVEWHLSGKTFAEAYRWLLDDFIETQRGQMREARRKGATPGELDRFLTTQAAVATMAGLSVHYLKRLIGPNAPERPGKDKVLALAQAIRCTRQQTARLLEAAGDRLDRFDRRDRIILSVIGTKEWETGMLDTALRVADLPPLHVREERSGAKTRGR